MKPQKAKHLHLEMEKKRPDCLHDDYMVFEKHDGWYGYHDHGGQIMSRNMRAIPSLEWLAKEMNDSGMSKHGRLVFEILVRNVPVFKDLNGILNRHEQAYNAYIKIHDCIPDRPMPFEERWNLALATASPFLNQTPIEIARVLQPYSNHTHWKGLAEQVWAEGGEGIIMKRLDAHYSPGSRIADLLKIKEELTLDLLVVDWVQGKEGKYEDILGALIVEEMDGTQHTISGMSDHDREVWYNDPSIILGCVVEVKAMKRLGNGSLREPRFKAIRYDKTAADID